MIAFAKLDMFVFSVIRNGFFSSFLDLGGLAVSGSTLLCCIGSSKDISVLSSGRLKVTDFGLGDL